jgi:hypothetical protein
MEAPGPLAIPAPVYRWYHKLGAFLLITLSLTIGIFLLIFPWTVYWDINYFALLRPEWHEYWTSTYARGAVSTLGILNLFVSLVEVFRLRRFGRR